MTSLGHIPVVRQLNICCGESQQVFDASQSVTMTAEHKHGLTLLVSANPSLNLVLDLLHPRLPLHLSLSFLWRVWLVIITVVG